MTYEIYIKPCDHCGGTVLVVNKKTNLVSCKKCNMGLYVLSTDTDSIIDDWNDHDWDRYNF
jgi:Ribonuclease G/E